MQHQKIAIWKFYAGAIACGIFAIFNTVSPDGDWFAAIGGALCAVVCAFLAWDAENRKKK